MDPSDRASLATFLAEDGFAVAENVVGPERVAALTAALDVIGAGYGRRNLLRDCPAVAALATDLCPLAAQVIGVKAFVVRALFFDKLPEANWRVDWHQDLSIAVAERIETPGFRGWSVKQGVPHVQPPPGVLETMVTLRVHLDDCSPENGPLRVLRGSHRQGRLDDAAVDHWRQTGKEVVCLVPRGGVLLMRPLLLHASNPAERPCHRRVVHLEYAADSLPGELRWFEAAEARTPERRY